jgi:hypothetical protein
MQPTIKLIFVLTAFVFLNSQVYGEIKDTVYLDDPWYLTPNNADSVLGINDTINPFTICHGTLPGDTTATIFILDLANYYIKYDSTRGRNEYVDEAFLITIDQERNASRELIFESQQYIWLQTVRPFVLDYAFDNKFICLFNRWGGWRNTSYLEFDKVQNKMNWASGNNIRCGGMCDMLSVECFSLCLCDGYDITYDPRGYIWWARYPIQLDSTVFFQGEDTVCADSIYTAVFKPASNWPITEFLMPISDTILYDCVSIAISKPDSNEQIYLYAGVIADKTENTMQKYRKIYCGNITNIDTIIWVNSYTLEDESYPRRMVVDESGNLFVADPELNRILKFTSQLDSVSLVISRQNNQIFTYQKPMDIDIIDGDFYIVASPNDIVEYRSLKSGGVTWPY